MRLSFHTTVPAPIEEVYEHVTAVGPEGPVDRALFAQKYGEPIETEPDGAVITHDPDDEDDVFWRCTFEFPSHRAMRAIESTWADREDDFETVRGGTRWTVTFIPKTGGLQGLVQYLYFQVVGKYRVGVPVLSPVVQHFRRKARGDFDAPPDADEVSADEASGAEEPPPSQGA